MSDFGPVLPATLRSIGFNKKELRSGITIDAPVESVWNILTDIDRFPEWNPFIKRISGRIEESGRLTVTFHPTGGRSTTFKPTVLKAEPNRELRWLGRLWIPGLFTGQHIFELNPVGEAKTRFVQREEFNGVFLPLLAGSLGSGTARGFDEMNAALKARAEAKAT